MRFLLRFTLKLFVYRFYELNAGFFLFWFFILFGLVKPNILPSYHLGLMKMIIQSTPALLLILVCWFLYNIKCVRFSSEMVHQYRNSFLYILQEVRSIKLWVVIGINHVLIFLPVFVYAILVGVVGFSEQNYLIAFLILIFVLFCCVASTYWIGYQINNFRESSENSLLDPLKEKMLPFKTYSCLAIFLFKEKKMNVLVLKTFSLGLFYLFFIFLVEGFHIGWFTFAILIIGYVHAVLIFYLQRFLEEKLAFMRNLPLSFTARYISFLLPIVLLFLPELFFMMVKGLKVLSFAEVMRFYFLLITQLALYASLLYVNHHKELMDYIQSLFMVFFVSTFLYLVINEWFLIVVQLALGYTIFQQWYLNYEHRG